MRNTLVLPIGGSASRMRGVPKYLLPANTSSTLVETHIRAGLKAGYDQIIIIIPKESEVLLRNILGENDKVFIALLPEKTKTMCETLLLGLSSSAWDDSDYFTVGLSDTIFVGEEMSVIYEKLLSAQSRLTLGLFKMRDEQVEKLGQVVTDSFGGVIELADKQPIRISSYAWGLAKFQSDYLKRINISHAHIGISFKQWLQEGERIGTVTSNSSYYDCGTFSEYASYIRTLDTDFSSGV